MKLLSFFVVLIGISIPRVFAITYLQQSYDIVVYGATPAGCASAIVASNNTGLRVALLDVSFHIGGMMVPGGIGLRDTDNFDSAFGNNSIARQWANLNGIHYGVPYVLQPDVVVGNASLYTLLQSTNGTIDIYPSTGLLEDSAFGPIVTKTGTVINSISTVDTSSSFHETNPVITVWSAKQFIDASYDGDLAVAAGCSYTYGRESKDTYNESLAGIQPFNTFQNILTPLDPYNHTTGEILPYIETEPLPPIGSADTKLMPFSYRCCLTRNTSNQVAFTPPPNYNADDFEILRRYVNAFNHTKWPTGPTLGDLVGLYDYGGPIPYPFSGVNMKIDLCEGGSGDHGQTSPITTDQPDINDGYVTANRSTRAIIANTIRYYVQGFLYTLATDKSIPQGTRNSTNTYGLCKDSIPFWGSDAWPTQLYIREGVRIIGDYVATQNNVIRGECTVDSIASSAWTIDIHPMRRVVVPAGYAPPYSTTTAMNEGQVGFQSFPGSGPVWEVRYALLTPKRTEVTNLLVPVCNSASHVVYGSIRVEPTFLQIGQAAGIGSYLAIKYNTAVQDVPINELQTIQRQYGVEPHYPPGRCNNTHV